MTDEEYLKKRLDRLNQNSHYGIMIDTEITDIVRNHIKRLEEMKMKATSVQTIENVKEMHFTIEKSGIDEITKVIVGASTNDDIFEFHLSGDGCVVFADQWFNAVAEKAYKVDFESERNKRQMMERENTILREKNRKLQKENEKLKEALDKECEKLTFQKLMLKEENKQLKEEISRCNKVNEDLGSNAIELEKRMQMYKQSQTQKIKELKKKLSLEKAANEAQHKFIREYAGKGTEVQFNYAIDDTKEVSYVIVDKEEYNKNFEKWANVQVENAPISTSRADILEQAKKCVCGQREQDYGTPESNFKLIADLWTDYLYPTLGYPKKDAYGIKATDVAMMMALMKIARIRNGGGSGDSFVDLAGYAACGGEIWHGQKVKDQN